MFCEHSGCERVMTENIVAVVLLLLYFIAENTKRKECFLDFAIVKGVTGVKE